MGKDDMMIGRSDGDGKLNLWDVSFQVFSFGVLIVENEWFSRRMTKLLYSQAVWKCFLDLLRPPTYSQLNVLV